MQCAGPLACVLSIPCSGKPLVDQSDYVSISENVREIPRKCLSVEHTIGAGHFAEVFLGSLNKTTKVAVKKLKSGLMLREDFLHEAGVMAQLVHDHLAQVSAKAWL